MKENFEKLFIPQKKIEKSYEQVYKHDSSNETSYKMLIWSEYSAHLKKIRKILMKTTGI